MKRIYLLFLLFFPLASFADLQLEVKDAITKKQKFRFETSLAYSTYLQGNRFLLGRENVDNFSLDLGLRYGILDNLEFNTKISASVNLFRIQQADLIKKNTSLQLDYLNFGINYQPKADDAYPAVLLFLDISIFENLQPNKIDFTYFRTLKLGTTIYHSIDPLVLSFTGAYVLKFNREIAQGKYNPGDVIFLSPNLAFAVTNEITLNTGLDFSLALQDKLNNKVVHMLTTQLNLNAGLSYSVLDNFAIDFATSAGISGNKEASVKINFIYSF